MSRSKILKKMQNTQEATAINTKTKKMDFLLSLDWNVAKELLNIVKAAREHIFEGIYKYGVVKQALELQIYKRILEFEEQLCQNSCFRCDKEIVFLFLNNILQLSIKTQEDLDSIKRKRSTNPLIWIRKILMNNQLNKLNLVKSHLSMLVADKK